MGRKITPTLISRTILVLALASALFLAAMSVGVRVAGATPFNNVQIDNPSPQTGALFGRSVAGISDLNGDSIGDLAAAARGADRVYLLSGADESIIHTIDDPDGVSGFWFGHSVRGVGDIDGDGVEDVAIGAPSVFGSSPVPGSGPEFEASVGRAFVFSGATGELILRIANLRFLLGAAVAPLGDVSGDGIPDVAVGAPMLKSNFPGGVYAISGADGSVLWETLESEPEVALGSFGMYMAEVRDLTGDDCTDLLVAAPYYDTAPDPNVQFSAGRAYVLSGSDGTIFRTHDSPAPVNNGFFGAGPSAIGDQDGDGVEDYAFGEAKVGVLHLFSGASGTPIGQIESPGDGSTDYFGFQVAKVDDKDGDSLDDFWVAAPMDENGGMVYLMNSIGDVIGQIDDPNPSTSMREGDFGWSISATEDLDGDGGLDLIIGKSVESVGGFSRAGVVFLVFGAPENIAPVASFLWSPSSPNEGQQVQFIDTSIDDGTIVSWSWTFGDGGTSTLQNPTYTYMDDGTYEVTLIVTDDDGSTDAVSHDVPINNVVPEVGAGADVTTDEGATIILAGSFTDPGSLDTHTINWDLGDGGTETGTLTPSHAYGDNGVYTGTLTVTDDDGGVGTDTLTVTVNNVAPVVEAGQDQEVHTGDTVSFSSSFTDPGWLDTHTIEWDFGDGTKDNTGTLTPTHRYLEAKDYEVTLTVTDDDGGVGSNTLEVTVKPIRVVIDIKPGSDPNSINPKGKGVIPVAILTTDDFDASTVDAETVRFGPSEAAAIHHSLEDVDGDGDFDMILQFKTQDVGLGPDDEEATLTGQTVEGGDITGADSVRIVSPSDKPKGPPEGKPKGPKK